MFLWLNTISLRGLYGCRHFRVYRPPCDKQVCVKIRENVKKLKVNTLICLTKFVCTIFFFKLILIKVNLIICWPPSYLLKKPHIWKVLGDMHIYVFTNLTDTCSLKYRWNVALFCSYTITSCLFKFICDSKSFFALYSTFWRFWNQT